MTSLTIQAFSAALCLLLSGIAAAQKVMTPTNNHPNPYTTINDYFPLPDGREWGSTSAVDIDIDGESIWVAERCGSNSCALSDVDPVIKYDPEGNILEAYYTVAPTWPQPLSVPIDLDGDDASVLRQIEEAKRAG